MDLQVEIPGRAPYRASRREFVPLILLGRLGVGNPLDVRVDRADPSRVVIDWGSAPAIPMSGMTISNASISLTGNQAAGAPAPTLDPVTGQPSAQSGAVVQESLSQVLAAMRSSGVQAPAPYAAAPQGNYTVDQLRDHLRAHGLPGTARIDLLNDTGQVVGDERMFTMQATLTMPGEEPRQLQPSVAMVPLTALHKLQVGREIPVRVAADNPQMVMFEWDKL
jgi:hypothetical protein